ncbi:hypothetical protein HZH68_008321 [Vespula germanica]|uniref:Uncharacterized protein n=1 Tax=Vespula germanica TaxID=30212 RepID=A0A834K3I9_VESGE|nr:hypothetical protein HZH68_008321 [Vespula germanica]
MASYVGIEGLDSPFGVSEVCTTSDRRREREKGDSFHGGGGGGGGEVEGMEKGKIAILKLLLIVWRPWQTSSRYFEHLSMVLDNFQASRESVDAKSRRVETNSQTKYYQEGACRKGPTEQKQTPASISHPPTILATTSLAATYGNLSEGSNTGWWNHCYRGVLVDVAETPESHLSGICERQQREKNALGH